MGFNSGFKGLIWHSVGVDRFMDLTLVQALVTFWLCFVWVFCSHRKHN